MVQGDMCQMQQPNILHTNLEKFSTQVSAILKVINNNEETAYMQKFSANITALPSAHFALG